MNYITSVKQLFYRLLLILVFYQICRIIFYLFNYNYFLQVGITEFLGGIRFDLSAIFFSNALLIALSIIPGNFKYKSSYQVFLKILFFVINAFFIAFNFVDIEYFRFTGKRSTYSLITASGMEGDIWRLIPVFIKDYWYLFLVYLLVIIIFWKLIPVLTYKKRKEKGIKDLVISSSVFIFSVGLIVLFGRGGFQKAPIKTLDAINYVNNSQNTAVVLNTPFTVFKTLSKKDNLKKIDYFPEDELKEIYQPVIRLDSDTTFNRKNVVILILESFGKENIHLSFDGRKLTPFLDSLLDEGMYYENAFASGFKSIDAVPSVITSIPCLMEISYISSPFAFNNVDGFSKILKSEDYYTAFFHGAFNGSQNFNEFAQIAGFDKYYGKNEYVGEEAYDKTWGIFDEEFMQFSVKEFSTFRQPFFSTIFTISSHNPYTIPERYKDKFPKGDRDIHESIAYSDYALGRFFESARKESWFENTIFVITPDHPSRGGKKGFFNTDLGNYSIPILIYDPSNPGLKGKNNKLLAQIDILPEVLDYLNYQGDIFSFGNDPLKSNNRLIANFSEGVYRFLIDDYYMTFDGQNILNVYNYKQDSLLQNKISVYPQQDFELKIKSYIQQYNARVLDNKLTLEAGF